MIKRYKTFETYLSGKMASLRNIKEVSIGKNVVEILLQEIIDTYSNLNKPGKKMEIEIEGWKGKGDISIYENFQTDFVVIEHIKDKDSDEVEERRTTIPVENVRYMLATIRTLQLNTTYKCYAIANKMGWDWKELWKNRTEVYFPKYYYPLKILQYLGFITYTSKGSVTRIK
jgi:hypothetical protein